MKNIIEQLQGKYVYANSDEEGAEIVRLMVKAGGNNSALFTGKADNSYYVHKNGRIYFKCYMQQENLTLSELRELVEPKEVQYFNPPVDMEVRDGKERMSDLSNLMELLGKWFMKNFFHGNTTAPSPSKRSPYQKRRNSYQSLRIVMLK